MNLWLSGTEHVSFWAQVYFLDKLSFFNIFFAISFWNLSINVNFPDMSSLSL